MEPPQTAIRKKDSDEDEPTVSYLPTITVNPTSLLDKKRLVPMMAAYARVVSS
jgi:hypothetical protein